MGNCGANNLFVFNRCVLYGLSLTGLRPQINISPSSYILVLRGATNLLNNFISELLRNIGIIIFAVFFYYLDKIQNRFLFYFLIPIRLPPTFVHIYVEDFMQKKSGL